MTATTETKSLVIKTEIVSLIDTFEKHVFRADPHEIAAYIEDIVEAVTTGVKTICKFTGSGMHLNLSILDEYVGLAWESVADLAQDFHGEMTFLYEELLEMFEQVCARSMAIINNC